MTFAREPVANAPSQDLGVDDVLFAMGARVPFSNGEEIFGQGEPTDLIYMIVRGVVRLTCSTSTGRHAVDLLSAPGDLFGLEPSPKHQMTAEALGDCVILVASRRGLACTLGATEFEALLAPEIGPHAEAAQYLN